MKLLYDAHVREGAPAAAQVRLAAEDAHDRLLFPPGEGELRAELTDRASTAAIRVFSVNLRQLLMQPPVKGRVALGLDPGYRTGCKTAVVDPTGKVLDTGVIYPAPPHKKIGGGQGASQRAGWPATASRSSPSATEPPPHETEVFASELLKELAAEGRQGIAYMVVSEAGRRSIPPPSWRRRSSRNTTCPCAPPSRSRDGSRIRWPSLSRSIPRPSVSANISMTCPRPSSPPPWTGVVEDCVNAVGGCQYRFGPPSRPGGGGSAAR